MPWAPSTDFENEVVSFQPDHDFIFGSLSNPQEDDEYYPRPESHLRYILEKKKKEKGSNEIVSTSKSKKLNIISKVQRIAGTKPIGEQPAIEDWEDDTHVERETIAMMRHVGLEPSVDEALDEQRTIATLPVTNDEILVMHNGRRRMPILYNEKFFKLRPRHNLPHEDNTDLNPTEQDKLPNTNPVPDHDATDELNSVAEKIDDQTCDELQQSESIASSDEDVIIPSNENSDTTMDKSMYHSLTEESFKTASSRNSSLSFFDDDDVKHANGKKDSSKYFLTAKELYFKYRKN